MGLIGGTKAAAAASRLLSLSVPRPLWGLKEDLECVCWCGVACRLAQAQIKAPKKTKIFRPAAVRPSLPPLGVAQQRPDDDLRRRDLDKGFFLGGARYVGGGEAGRGRSGRMEGFEKKARKKKFTRGEGLS